MGSDCVSGTCAADGPPVCLVNPCADGIKNNEETDVDCGGLTCAKCALGRACLSGSDCLKNSCQNQVCSEPSCTNGAMDGEETAPDCGGSLCPGCAKLMQCNTGTDCLSGSCINNLCT